MGYTWEVWAWTIDNDRTRIDGDGMDVEYYWKQVYAGENYDEAWSWMIDAKRSAGLVKLEWR